MRKVFFGFFHLIYAAYQTMHLTHQDLLVEYFKCTIQEVRKPVGLRLGEMLVTKIVL